jgi:hypothetical protein
VKYELPHYLRLKDTVTLLTGEVDEHFEFERAISLFEFQTWIYWPQTNSPQPEEPNSAGLMAAVFILEEIEDDIYWDEADSAYREENYGEAHLVNLNDKPDATLYRINALRANKTYRNVHDRVFAARGGLSRLLYCPTPEEFDADVAKRREKAQIVADLVDYRLRYAQHRPTNGHINISHAVFLKWWPTHHIPGKRGATVEGKSMSTKKLFERWR